MDFPRRQPRVLIAAHRGLPIGGISENYESLLASDLIRRADIVFVETSRGGLAFDERGGSSLSNILDACGNIVRFTAALRRTKPDVVHLGTAGGLSLLKHGTMALIAWLLGYKVIMQFHFSYGRLQISKPLCRISMWMIGHCSGAIIISREWERLRESFPRMKVAFIPNAIDTSQYADMARPRDNSNYPGISLLYLGHLGTDKGTYDLLDAVVRLQEEARAPFMLHMYGESLEAGARENVMAVIAARGLSSAVRVHEPVCGDDKKASLASSDVFILPSHHEGMPISIIEAMAAGLPVVATDVGGIGDEVVHEQTGLLVRSHHPEELCAALGKLIADRELRMRMGSAGRKRAQREFDSKKKARSLLAFYESITSGSNEAWEAA